MNYINPVECAAKWRCLAQRHILHRYSNDADAALPADQLESTQPDPFDCSDLIVPPTSELVRSVLERGIEQWKALDSRCISGDDDVESTIAGEDTERTKRLPALDISVDTDEGHDKDESSVDGEAEKDRGDYAGTAWGWHANRIRLPDHFDVTCKHGPPKTLPALDSRKKKRRRQVVSLENPLERLDYETELWHLFRSLPTEAEIERDGAEFGCMCANTLALRNEIDDELKNYTRLDAHALGRMRMKERHHFPSRLCIPKDDGEENYDEEEIMLKQSMLSKGIGGMGAAKKNIEEPVEFDGVVISVECWRRMLKRGSSVDNNRLEMEFLGNHTLLDVHRAIVDCGNDELFSQLANATESASGMFFVEGVFYTTGEVDYSLPVLKWLGDYNEETIDIDKTIVPLVGREEERNGGRSPSRPEKESESIFAARKAYLGIPPDQKLRTESMANFTLESLTFRLGVRYLHVYHGDCESAFFISDVRCRTQYDRIPISQYPLIHDVWMSASTRKECSGCEDSPAVVVTFDDELTDGGPTPLCGGCYYKLHYKADGKKLRLNNDSFRVFPLEMLQDQNDISVGHEANNALF